MDLNIADIYIMAGIAISSLIGIYRGFIREFLTLVTWIIAFIVAYTYGAYVGEYFFFIDSPGTKEILGMISIFFGVVFVGFLVKLIVCKAAKISGVSPLDRLAGALFGILRGCVIVVLVLWAASSNITNQAWYKNSQLIPRFAKAADLAATMTPKEWKNAAKKEVADFMNKEQAPAPVTAAKPAVKPVPVVLDPATQKPAPATPAAANKPTTDKP